MSPLNSKEAKKAIVIFSGGPDSTAAAQWCVTEGYKVELLTFQFANGRGQDGELFSAKAVAAELGLKHTIFDFSSPLLSFSPQSRVLMHIGVPESKNRDSLHLLQFGSGMVLATVACYALYNEIDAIVWGATKDDGYLNKDYTQGFASSFAKLISDSVNKEFNIIVPFSDKHKHEILSIYKGREDLFAKTFSCLVPKEDKQCGICKACTARRTAAKLAELVDLTPYCNMEQTNSLASNKHTTMEPLPDVDFKKVGNTGLKVIERIIE